MKPNILFILVDSMRADKFFPKNQTKKFQNILDNGIYFEQNISSSDYTVTGVGSIFTACYPFDAGLKGQSFHKLYATKDNYIEFLKRNGYHAYATMAESVAELGFSKLFENKDQSYPNSLRLFDGLGEKILNLLNSGRFSEPWIYFIHLEDLHLPVLLPSKYSHVKYSDRYDLAISEIHSWIDKFTRTVNLENCLVVITSDHGDYIPLIDDSIDLDSTISKTKSLIRKNLPSNIYGLASKTKQNFQKTTRKAQAKSSYEKRAIDSRTGKNRYLYDEMIRTPLFFTGFGISSQKTIHQQVRSIDIFPTICDIFDLHSFEAKIDGQSLKPLFENKSIEELPVYLESTVFETIQKNAIAHLGIRTPKFKYFRKAEDPTENIHLYDLENDSFEENNISSENPDIIEKMEKEIKKIRSESVKQQLDELSLEETKKVEDELRKLGYL